MRKVPGPRRVRQSLSAVTLLTMIGCVTLGCGAPIGLPSPLIALSPSAATVQVGELLVLSPSGLSSSTTCHWTTSDTAVLTSEGKGTFRGRAPGEASAVAACGDAGKLTASIIVTSTSPGPLLITKGGTYSGVWASNDPSIPAVSVLTNEPVLLRNSIITGRGDLIDINGTGSGANVTIRHVTGTALDPGISGLQRGAFVSAEGVATLKVQKCSMYGVSFGVKVLSSRVSSLNLSKNLARDLEDRASDGEGGLSSARPSLGHFIFLYQDSLPAGAEIAWNQVVDTIGASSVEDVINIFKSSGSPNAAIHIHDNYLEGYSASATPGYTGAGIITDGDSSSPVTAFVTIEGNQMVHAAGSGAEIAVGHDIVVKGNRFVSCGMNADGHWFAQPFINAVILWNYYGAPDFYNNTVETSAGGMLRPASDNSPEIADQWVRSSDLNASDTLGREDFTDPCLVNGQIHLEAEDAERAYWTAKLAQAGIRPGDTHHP